MQKKSVIHLVAAARPNFMKIAPLFHGLAREDWASAVIVHTGQHYDRNMSDTFFSDLGLPPPAVNLGVGSGTHAEQTGGVMVAYERLCEKSRPDATIVVGDVNSTMACAFVATRLAIPVVHLEAGLRSRDRRMPEEINRLMTDAICDYLWTPSPDADQNLLAEGIPANRIRRVGNIMMDSYELVRGQIEADPIMVTLGFQPREYAVVTLHRPSNVDDLNTLRDLVNKLTLVAHRIPVVFPVHPRTRSRLEEAGLMTTLASNARIKLIEPLGYIPFMNLVQNSRAVVTDSGGVQEETTYLSIPCLTLRENTERPITVEQGTNRLVRSDNLLEYFDQAMAGRWKTGSKPEFWDGKTAARCVAALREAVKATT